MDIASLRAHLSEYEPDDGHEAVFRQQMFELLESAHLSWSRGHFSPGHFTASAYVVYVPTAEVAMIYHKNLKRWLQPGGHIEDDDSNVIEAARRELREETGLAPEEEMRLIDLDVHLIPDRADQPEHRHFDLRFACFMSSRSEKPALNPADDADQAVWSSLSSLIENEEAGIRRVAAKILSQINRFSD